ncbi:drug/metabolite transporter (DMT)-like permease [Siphonobacter sp. BAB-5404]|nr:drug/metabolite transporter (DMT)-like permease [Siphonobacter sp. SORGH_AS_0500]
MNPEQEYNSVINLTEKFMQKSTPPIAWVILMGLALTWGSSFILMKQALHTFSGIQIASFRLLAAGAFFVPILLTQVNNLPTAKQWFWGFVCGMVGSFIPAYLFSFAVMHMNSSLVGILNAFTPLFVLIIGFLFFKQKMTSRQVIGLALGLIGCILITLSGNKGAITFNYYSLLVILATVLYGINPHLLKTYLSDLKPFILTGITFVTVAPLAAAFLFQTDFVHRFEEAHAGWSFAAAVTLGLVGSGIAMIFYNQLLQLTGPVFVSSVTYLMPIIAVAWGVIDHEQIQAQHFVGMAIILFGVYLVNSTPKIKSV